MGRSLFVGDQPVSQPALGFLFLPLNDVEVYFDRRGRSEKRSRSRGHLRGGLVLCLRIAVWEIMQAAGHQQRASPSDSRCNIYALINLARASTTTKPPAASSFRFFRARALAPSCNVTFCKHHRVSHAPSVTSADRFGFGLLAFRVHPASFANENSRERPGTPDPANGRASQSHHLLRWNS